jgi:hypothetical protein
MVLIHIHGVDEPGLNAIFKKAGVVFVISQVLKNKPLQKRPQRSRDFSKIDRRAQHDRIAFFNFFKYRRQIIF